MEKEKKIYIVATDREYKGVSGYDVEAISFDEEKARKAFNEWKTNITDEFINEIRERDENGVEVTDDENLFIYNDNHRYYILGTLGDCPCTKEVEQGKDAFVGVVGGLSDGNEVDNYKVFTSEKSAIDWMKNEIFAIKKEWEDVYKKDISWYLNERYDYLELDSDEVSVSVFGFVKKRRVL